MMARRGSEWAVAIMIIGSGVSNLQAEDPTAAKQYGAGVHDYYQGRYSEALQHLDAAIGLDGRNPRAYFFRGLAKRRLGYSWDADTDFQLGAQLEVALSRRDVGRSLQRIQGPDRLKIEQFRREATQLPPELVKQVVPPRSDAVVQRRTAPRAVQPANANITLPDLPSDDTDPFGADAEGFLGRGEIQVAADEAAKPKPSTAGANDGDAFADDFDNNDPFGSGVVAEASSDDDMQDPFAPAGDTADATNEKPGVFGAAVRAFSRAVAPAAVTDQGKQLLDRARGGPAEPSGATVAPDDPFGDPPANQSPPSQDPGPENADDPFAPLDDDPLGEAPPANDQPAHAAGAADNAEADDPFAPLTDDSSADPPADDAEPPSTETTEDPFLDDPFNFE